MPNHHWDLARCRRSQQLPGWLPLGVDVDVISLGALLDRDDEIRSDAVTL